jgi:hypothetical protein
VAETDTIDTMEEMHQNVVDGMRSAGRLTFQPSAGIRELKCWVEMGA